jgi:aspartate carbamoyltransferase catalytic subunit
MQEKPQITGEGNFPSQKLLDIFKITQNLTFNSGVVYG